MSEATMRLSDLCDFVGVQVDPACRADVRRWRHSRVRHRAEQVLASARPARKGLPQTRQDLKANLAT